MRFNVSRWLNRAAIPTELMSLIACCNESEVTSSGSGPNVAHGIDPLEDRRWDEFVQRHPRASLFHSRAWLEALSRTYRYKPIAFTTSPAGQRLENGILFCQVESWLTGRRLVSLPFSDHCEPLVDTEEDLDAIAVVRVRTGRVCPLLCPKGQQANGERCVVRRQRPATIAARPAPPPSEQTIRSASPSSPAPGKRCITSSVGQIYCE